MLVNGEPRTGDLIGEMVILGRYWRVYYYGTVEGATPSDVIQIYEWRGQDIADRNGATHRQVWAINRGDVSSFPVKVDREPIRLSSFEVNGVSAIIAQGSVRVIHMTPPIEPDLERVRQAVRDMWMTHYSRFDYDKMRVMKSVLIAKQRPFVARGYYRPDLIAGTDGVSMATGTSMTPDNSNFCGVTSGDAGEHDASRGFFHDVDARIIELATHLHNVGSTHEWMRFTWEVLSHPQGAIWSPSRHRLRDPQVPEDGEPLIVQEYSSSTSTPQDRMVTLNKWDRDNAHLENIGFVHALSTGDPAAFMCLQRQLAYCMSKEWVVYLRTGTWVCTRTQERSGYNHLRSIWTNYLLSLLVWQKTPNVMLWGRQKIWDIFSAVYDDYYTGAKKNVPSTIPATVPVQQTADVIAQFVRSVNLRKGDYTFFPVYTNPSHPFYPAVESRGDSDFFMWQYAPEVFYLLAYSEFSPVRERAREMWERYFFLAYFRLHLIGGVHGVRLRPTGRFSNSAGSSAMYMVTWAPDGKTGVRREPVQWPFTTSDPLRCLEELADWWKNVLWPRTDDEPDWGPINTHTFTASPGFEGAAAHTMQRMYFVLLGEAYQNGPHAHLAREALKSVMSCIARSTVLHSDENGFKAKNCILPAYAMPEGTT